MKLVIAGSRDINEMEILEKALTKFSLSGKISEVVSGCAKGVDKLGEEWAEANGIPVKKFPADWKNIDHPKAFVKENAYGKYNARAGFIRNKQMAEYCDSVLVVYENENDVVDMIKQGKEAGKKVFVYDVNAIDLDVEDEDNKIPF